MKLTLYNMLHAWQKTLENRTFRNQLALSVLLFTGVCLHQFHFLREWQHRSGISVNDVILSFFPPRNFSVPIFILEYSCLLIVFFTTLFNPYLLLRGIQMFILVLFARTVTIYFVPLEPPHNMILLNDPIASFFLHSSQVFVTKDLFFSGHVSALTLLFLIATNRYVKAYAFVAMVAVGIMIMWQHVHYSMDVMFAPIVSYGSYKLVSYLHRETKYGLELRDAYSD